MNKQYIKRQITLHMLGIPMSEDIKEYYDYFHQLMGNIEDIEAFVNPVNSCIRWRKGGKGGKVILQYNPKNKHFWINHDYIWLKFVEKFRLDYITIGKLFSAMLEIYFKLEVKVSTYTQHEIETGFYYYTAIDHI